MNAEYAAIFLLVSRDTHGRFVLCMNTNCFLPDVETQLQLQSSALLHTDLDYKATCALVANVRIPFHSVTCKPVAGFTTVAFTTEFHKYFSLVLIQDLNPSRR